MKGADEHNREPCPDRILDDIGSGFCMGTIGGSVFHFLKGMYNHPSGGRLSGGVQTVRMNAPRVGGGFAVWSGLFSLCDCSMVYARQKDDPWNSIISGAATGGILSMRKGFRASARSALVGGVLLALIEGLWIGLNRVKDDLQIRLDNDRRILMKIDQKAKSIQSGVTMGKSVPETSSGSGSWFGKGKRKEERV